MCRKSLVLIETQDHEGNVVAQGSGFFIAPNWVATTNRSWTLAIIQPSVLKMVRNLRLDDDGIERPATD